MISSTYAGLRRRVSNTEDVPLQDAPEQSNQAVEGTDLLPDASECSPLDQAVVQSATSDGSASIATDPVGHIDRAMGGALGRWRTDRDPNALRRALVRLLADLEELKP
jgi:hypothetical protein